MESDKQRILSFWFDRPPLDWLFAPAGLDDQVKSEFGALVLQASQNNLDSWAQDPQGSAALVTLLDQFRRNIYRGTAECFSFDAKAFSIASQAIDKGFDAELGVLEVTGLCMCLLHREDLESAKRARGLFAGLLRDRCAGVEEEVRKWVELGVEASERHMEQLERFGRYPTRNKILRRENTVDEDAFLKGYEPGVLVKEKSER